MSIMQLLKIAPYHYINTDHIVEVTYNPATIPTEEIPGAADLEVPKTTEHPSCLRITRAIGKSIDLFGEEADNIYTQLTGEKLPLSIGIEKLSQHTK
jgi:hypothetical protein